MFIICVRGAPAIWQKVYVRFVLGLGGDYTFCNTAASWRITYSIPRPRTAGLKAADNVKIVIKLPATPINAVALSPISAPERAVEIGFNPSDANIIKLIMRPVMAGEMRFCSQVISKMLL